MITLNLINEIEKTNLNKERLGLTIRNTIAMFLVVIIVVGILFLVSKIYLQNNYHDVMSQITSINMQNKGISNEIKTLNSDLNKIDQIQQDFIKWSYVLVELFKLIPQNNQLVSLSIDKENNRVDISGKSLYRNDLLKLKNGLEDCQLLDKIKSPLTNLLDKEKINFSFNATFVPPIHGLEQTTNIE